MRSNDRYRAMWRRVAAPATVASGADLDALAARISLDGSLALRARARAPRLAIYAGVAAAVLALLALSVMPRQPQATLLEAVSGGEAPARTFEVAMVGPRDGTWLIAAAVGTDAAAVSTDR